MLIKEIMSKIFKRVCKAILFAVVYLGNHCVIGQNAASTNNQSFTIDENSGRYGAIASITVDDQDHDQMTYNLINENDIFNIDQNGQITVKRTGLFFVNRLDFETQSQYELEVQVTNNDPSSPPVTRIVTIDLNDINEFPRISLKEYYIAGNNSNGARVGKVEFSDDDSGQTHEFAILAGNTDSIFDLNQSTGELRIRNDQALQANGKATYALTIAVSDDGEPKLTGTGTVSIHVID